MQGVKVRTGLEDTLSGNALRLGAEANAADGGAISKLKNGIYELAFILDRRRSEGRRRKIVGVVACGAGKDWADGVCGLWGVRQRHVGEKE